MSQSQEIPVIWCDKILHPDLVLFLLHTFPVHRPEESQLQRPWQVLVYFVDCCVILSASERSHSTTLFFGACFTMHPDGAANGTACCLVHALPCIQKVLCSGIISSDGRWNFLCRQHCGCPVWGIAGSEPAAAIPCQSVIFWVPAGLEHGHGCTGRDGPVQQSHWGKTTLPFTCRWLAFGAPALLQKKGCRTKQNQLPCQLCNQILSAAKLCLRVPALLQKSVLPEEKNRIDASFGALLFMLRNCFKNCLLSCMPALVRTRASSSRTSHGAEISLGLQGSVPAYWGSSEAFPKLRNLNLAFNPRLEGTLPADWGSDGTSMQLLRRQEVLQTVITFPSQTVLRFPWGKLQNCIRPWVSHLEPLAEFSCDWGCKASMACAWNFQNGSFLQRCLIC